MHALLVGIALSLWPGLAPAATADGPPLPLAETFEIQSIPFSKADVPRGARIRGDYVTGSRFLDRTGENLVILTQQTLVQDKKTSVYLRAYLLRKSGDAWKRVRLVKDAAEGCEYENVTGFVDESLSVTDLDDDGLAEVTFAYRVDCVSGIVPARTKLLVLEDGAKYALRGASRVGIPGTAEGGGETTQDPAFAKAPAVIRRFARERWNELADHYH